MGRRGQAQGDTALTAGTRGLTLPPGVWVLSLPPEPPIWSPQLAPHNLREPEAGPSGAALQGGSGAGPWEDHKPFPPTRTLLLPRLTCQPRAPGFLQRGLCREWSRGEARHMETSARLDEEGRGCPRGQEPLPTPVVSGQLQGGWAGGRFEALGVPGGRARFTQMAAATGKPASPGRGEEGRGAGGL